MGKNAERSKGFTVRVTVMCTGAATFLEFPLFHVAMETLPQFA